MRQLHDRKGHNEHTRQSFGRIILKYSSITCAVVSAGRVPLCVHARGNDPASDTDMGIWRSLMLIRHDQASQSADVQGDWCVLQQDEELTGTF